MRQPGHPSKRPTREASKPGRSKPLFNLRHKANPPIPPFPVRASNNVSLSRTHFVAKGHVKEILILKLVQVKKYCQSDPQCLPGLNPFRGKSPVKETLILEPVQASRKITRLQRRRRSTRVGEHKLEPLFHPPFSRSSE